MHDIGKYAQAFQEKLNGRHNNYSHAAPGAIEFMENADKSQRLTACMLAYCIAGHHTGLPDGGANAVSRSRSAEQSVSRSWQ
ncbi:MAG: CRISPR-associated endonuclease Cas3'' [Oscillospiraceae bacterium]|nr:CRISPR-associated endonuclease Cas3'' [Oscillospiraceae bacterium]